MSWPAPAQAAGAGAAVGLPPGVTGGLPGSLPGRDGPIREGGMVTGAGMLPGDPGELSRQVPVGRLGTPGEVAGLAMAMLRNGYLTSQVVSLDGGRHPR